MRSSTKRKLIKAIDIAVQALEIKCGGRGGTPGPCPGSGKPKPGSKKPPKKPTVSDRIDPKNPKPKISTTELASAGIKVKNGQLSIGRATSAKQALAQLTIVQKIHGKAMTMVAAALKLPKTDPMRFKILMAAQHVDRQYTKVLSNAKRLAAAEIKSADSDRAALKKFIEDFEKVRGVLPDLGEDTDESVEIPIDSEFVEIGE